MPRPIVAKFTPAATASHGLATGVSGASWPLTATSMADGLAHIVTIKNDTGNDKSGINITIVGLDADGKSQTETITGPAGSATVSSAKSYSSVTSITPASTWGADTADLGFTAVAVSPTFPVNYIEEPFNLGQSVEVTGTINVTLQHTHDDCWLSSQSAVYFADGTIASVTANTESTLNLPVRACRLLINSVTASATVTLTLIQGQGT